MVMVILRSLIGMVGGIMFIVGIISVWAKWVANENTSSTWTFTIVGALMWLQTLPLLIATIKEKLREPE